MSSAVLQGRIVVYSIVGCPFCLRAKNKLTELNLPYVEISLDRFPQSREDLKKRTGGKTSVPQIFFNDKYIGGNAELQELVKNSGEFGKLVAYVKETPPPLSAPEIPDSSTAVDNGGAGEFVCEPDEYATLVSQMRNGGVIKDHTSIIHNYKRSFKGQDLVDWLVAHKHIDMKHAIAIGQQLISRKFGHDVRNVDADTFQLDKYYRLIEDDDSKALNSGVMSQCAPVPAAELGESLRKLILQVYNQGLSKDGRTIDYEAIARDCQFEKYVQMTRELQRLNLETCSRSEKLAFFINIYNALVIHASIKHGAPSNMWQRYKFFNTSCYIIGGQIYSLQDIENGVLRANRKGVGMITKPFKDKDPRAKIALAEPEPLIHFALNCGAKSCPPIKTFSSKGVKAELIVAAEAFFESDDALVVDVKNKEIKISQIFKWYKADFGGTPQSTAEFIAERIADGEKKKTLVKVIEAGNYKVTYLHYDWGQNSKH